MCDNSCDAAGRSAGVTSNCCLVRSSARSWVRSCSGSEGFGVIARHLYYFDR